MEFEDFVRDRDEAITEAVLNDNWSKVRKYCKKYKIKVPDDESVFKAGIYKAAQECTGISQEIKDIAFEKCLALNFYPFMMDRERKNQKNRKK